MKLYKKHTTRGFTIVELLIVIVIIGILAAITIVAYNGVQQRAKESTLKSDLANVARKMSADNALTGSYALTQGAVDDNKGLSASNGTTYQFQSTGVAYCVTGTNGNVSFKVSSASSSPTAGGCPGDDAGGVAAIMNLATNPSFETNTTGWGSTWVATPVARVTSGVGIVTGSAALEVSLTTANASGAQFNFGNLQPSTAYRASAYVTLVSGVAAPLIISASDGAGTRANTSISSSLIVGQPVRVSLGWTSSATPNGALAFMHNGTATGVGVIRIDNLMITAGSNDYLYADGNSPNWTWTGTPNNSTSKGQAQ
ncbi:putative major pilin subunit [compost metagenome]